MGRMGIPILMYHEVGPKETMAERYTVSIEAFREQMSYLRANGYQTISLDQYRAETMAGRAEDGGKKVIVTFDDNNLSHHSISTPILAEFNLQATFFIVSGFLDNQPEMITTGQLREMKQAGMSIQSHSNTHRFLNDLNDQDLRDELEISRRVLEDCVQEQVRFVSCPGGCYSKTVLRSALARGYFGVCTSAPGLNKMIDGQPPQRLDRFLVSATTPLATFAKIVSGEKDFVNRQIRRNRVKAAIKKLMGNDLYYKFWLRLRKDL